MAGPADADRTPDGELYEERYPDSTHIECVWQARAVREERYLVPAVEYWDLWFARQADGGLAAGMSGPTVGHRWIKSVVGEHGWGVQLQAHVVMPGVGKKLLLGGEQRLPVENGCVVIGEHRVRFPEYGELEAFTERLLELGILRSDEEVRRVLSGDDVGYSERQWQRRVRDATGLTRKQIAQLARARDAFALLQRGVAPAECAVRCGFADQAHLTRSLGLLRGETPGRILADRR